MGSSTARYWLRMRVGGFGLRRLPRQDEWQEGCCQCDERDNRVAAVLHATHGHFDSVILNRNSNEPGGLLVERSCFFESCMKVQPASVFSV